MEKCSSSGRMRRSANRAREALGYGRMYAAVGMVGMVSVPAAVPRVDAPSMRSSGPCGVSISVSGRNLRAGQEFVVRASGTGSITLYEMRFGYYMPAGPVPVGSSSDGRISYRQVATYSDEVVNGGLGPSGAQGYLFYASTDQGRNRSASIRVLVRK